MKIVRRTFILLILAAVAREMAIFLSSANNRIKTWLFLESNTQKLIAWLSSLESKEVTNVAKGKKLDQSTSKSSITKNNSQLNKLGKGNPVKLEKREIQGVSFYQTSIDLTDSQTLLTIGLANQAKMANSAQFTKGDEPFNQMVNRYRAAVIANGTFFSKDQQKRVMGNMVTAGKFIKYSQWENFGTTLGLRAGNKPEMITTRVEGKPNWNKHWFSLTCGPRLLKNGKIWLAPKSEGFADPHVLEVAYRTAIGFPVEGKELYLISFLASLSLEQEAEIMREIGCHEAMNLDGGASEGLAYQGEIIINPARNLTNVIVVYDRNYPAPSEVQIAWQNFHS